MPNQSPVSVVDKSVVIFEDKSYTPRENPYGPLDVCATLFDHFNIPMEIQKVDTGGRPRYLLEGEAKVIL